VLRATHRNPVEPAVVGLQNPPAATAPPAPEGTAAPTPGATPPATATGTPPTEPVAATEPERTGEPTTTPKQQRHLRKPKHAAVATTETPAPMGKPAGPKPAPLAAIQSPDAKREPAAPVKLEGEGTLLLASSPWCNVKVDGVDKGPTPVSMKLPAGKHTVLLSNPEFKISRTLPVMILPNETTRKRLDFAQ
ncbi:MAG: PEGA domain-containing protein, partial [Polyangia bacterium]